MKRETKKIEKKKINKQFIINIIFGFLILCLIIVLLLQNMTKKNVVEKKIKNPYDIEVSDTDNFVLLGDSITEWYPIDEFYDDLPVINSGVAGYQTDDVLNNLKEMVSIYNPTKVFILIGTNDIVVDKGNDKIVSNIKSIVKGIQELRPNAKIYLQSIYPVNNTDDEKIDDGAVKNRENKVIKEINRKLKSYCKDKGITYIDVYSELLDKEGNLDLKYTKDGLHMSNLGYLRETKTLLPYFQD